jgi:hypothetical protein
MAAIGLPNPTRRLVMAWSLLRGWLPFVRLAGFSGGFLRWFRLRVVTSAGGAQKQRGFSMSTLTWLRQLVGRTARGGAGRRRSGRSRWGHCVPRLEVLEGRLVPASIITVVPTGTGTLDGFLSPTDGTITTSDGGNMPGTLSVGALEGVNSNVDISISALNTLDFTQLDFNTLALQTAAGHTAAFTAGSGAILFGAGTGTLTTAGADLNLTATTSIDPHNLASSGGDISLTANNLSINGPVNAGIGKVILAPATPGLRIDLGAPRVPGVTFGLTDTELGEVTAGVLRLPTTGNITISGAVTRHPGFSTLSLQSGTGISQTAPLSVASLDAFAAAGGVALTNAGNDVDTIAGLASGGGAFSYTDATALAVGAVDFDTGVQATNANITLTATTLSIQSPVNAGTGDVSLTAGDAATTGTITSTHPNDGVADVIGRTVTLTALGPSNGNTGQIGFFTTSAQFFEVAATTLNASTNNSRLWVSAIGGTAVGSVNAGTNTAFLRAVNGDLTSTHTGSTPDVTAAAVNLSSPGTTGSFGSAANPLLVQTSSLQVSVTGTGSINVTNAAAGGDLSLASATTTNGAINLAVAGGNLTTTAASGTDISAPGNTVTLSASGAVVSGTAAGVTDVAASSLAAPSANGVGTSASPLKTAVGSLAASDGTGGVFVTNTGAALSLGTVGALSGVTATGGNVSITTNHDLTVSQAVSTATSGANAGAVTLTAGTAAASNINVNAAVTGSSASVLGGSGADAITVTATGATPLSVNGMGGGDSIVINFGALTAAVNVNQTGGGTNTLTVNGQAAARTYTVTAAQVTDNSATPQQVTYSGVQGLTVNGGDAGNDFNVQSTPAGATTAINTGGGNDAVYVSSAVGSGGNLNGLRGPLVIDAGAGSNFLTVSAAGGSGPDTFTLTGNSIADTAVGFHIGYQASGGTFAGVNLATGPGAVRVNVQSTAAGAITGVLNFGGSDTIDVCSDTVHNQGDLSGLKGPLLVEALGGTDLLVASEAGRRTGDAVVVTATGLGSGVGAGFTIYYTAAGGTFTGINFAAGSGDDRFAVQGTPAGVPVALYTGGGNDIVNVGVGPDSGYNLTVDGTPYGGGSGSAALGVADLSGTAAIENVPSGLGAGVVRLLYAGKKPSTVTYRDVDRVFTSPAAG